MNSYSIKQAPIDPESVVCDSRRPQWTEREIIGGGPGEVEIRKTPSGLLVSIDGRAPIAPGGTQRICLTSPIPWVGTSFSVSAECAHRFLLKSMRHALREYVPLNPIACTLFSDAQCCECRAPKVVRHLPTEWPTVMPGCVLEIEVENVSDQPSHFRATFEAIRVPSHLGCL